MRKIARTRIPDTGIARCILYECEDGVYVFPCTSMEDGSAQGDHLLQTVKEAEQFCEAEFGILGQDWEIIDDPLQDCQHDWIASVRIKGRAEGKPQWGVLERLVDGEWQEFWHE